MTYFVEVRPTVHRTHRIRLVPLADVINCTGFRSVFAFSEDTAARITEERSTRGLSGTDVYSDVLLVDFDTNSAAPFLEYLVSAGIGFEIYDTGNRGSHVHVLLEPMFGDWVPSAQRQWVKAHAPTADTSFYHPAGMYRLPRTYHVKRPGHCKTLIHTTKGKPLVIPRPLVIPAVFRLGSDEEQEETFWSLLLRARGEGGRRPHLWLLATTAAECGIDMNNTLDYLAWWNSKLSDPPHDADTIYNQCQQAYRRASNGY